jgi:hypothetical protein
MDGAGCPWLQRTDFPASCKSGVQRVPWSVVVRRLVLLVGLAFGCDPTEDRGPGVGVVGTITIGGKPAKVASCKATPGPAGAVLEIALEGGLVLVADPASGMRWKKGDTGDKLECTRVVSRQEADGARSKGDLALTCKYTGGQIVADLHVDCGER